MLEKSKTTVLELDVIDPNSGEVFQIQGSQIESKKYYNIKNITSRINLMDLLTVMEKVCKSPKDIAIVNYLLDLQNKEGRVMLKSIKDTAEGLNISRVKLTKLLKLLVDNNLFHKEQTGVYLVNPYIVIGKRIRSNLQREALQNEWNSLT